MFFKKDLHSILIISLVVILLSLPFLNKAIHIDDTANIDVARQITKDPLEPYSFEFDWSSESGLATHISNPPLISYYIAIILLLFGRSELILHFSFMIFPIIAGISMFYIAKKFTNKPLASSLLLVTSVAFVVMMHDIMLDVPFIAFFLLSLALFIYGVDSRNNYLMTLGAVFGGLSYLTKYSGIIIIPILAFYAIFNRKYKPLIYLTIPIIFIALWNLYTYIIYGFPHNSLILNWLLTSQNSFSLQAIIIRLLTNLVYIGGAVIFPLMLLYPFIVDNKSKLAYVLIAIASSITSVALFFISENFAFRYTLGQLVLFAFLLSTGSFFLFVIARHYYHILLRLIKSKSILDNKQQVDNIFLFTWFLIVFLFINTLAGGAVRYITILTPPMMIIYLRIIDNSRFFNHFQFRRFIFLTLVMTSILSLFVAFADYRFADVYRDFSETAYEYKSDKNKIWFLGHSGFQYYMQGKNYNILGLYDNSPEKGDIIIKARIPSPRKFSPLLKERLVLLDTKSYADNFPLRLHNPKARAGFYTYGGGFLPYSISKSNLEDFEIYEVVR